VIGRNHRFAARQIGKSSIMSKFIQTNTAILAVVTMSKFQSRRSRLHRQLSAVKARRTRRCNNAPPAPTFNAEVGAELRLSSRTIALEVAN